MNVQLTALVKRLAPEQIKPALRKARRVGRGAAASLGTPLRASAYRSPSSWWLRPLPAPLRRWWRLEVPSPGSRRIEVGSGWNPLPGYIHVDIDPNSFKVDLLVRGHVLPFIDSWADEVLSVHMIEHIPPPVLKATLREWHRVLREGGELRTHTPNGEVLGRALVDNASGKRNAFWAVQSAIFGHGCSPTNATGPERLSARGDHRMIFTFPELRDLLEEAGFSQVADVSGEDPCHHARAFASYIPGLCLEVKARKHGSALIRG